MECEDVEHVVHAARTVGSWLAETVVRAIARSVSGEGELYLTIEESANFLGVSQSSVRSYMDKGLLSCVRSATNRVRIKKSELAQFRDLREGKNGYLDATAEPALVDTVEVGRHKKDPATRFN